MIPLSKIKTRPRYLTSALLIIMGALLKKDGKVLDSIMNIKPEVLSVSIFLEDYANILQEAEVFRQEAIERKRLGDMIGYKTLMSKHSTYMITAEAVLNAAIKRPMAEA